ncbi:MAG: hypothetical protein KJZ77_18480 [Anaerolineales bacterium]|nr:hypothetical protein [Anaerolineales bacterium]
MAKVRNNIFIRGLSGSLGEQFILKHDRAGRTIISNVPTFGENRVFSEAQLEQQERFKDAVVYAKDAKSHAMYAEKAAGTGLTTFNVAMADYFNAPEIRDVDASAWEGGIGETLRIKVEDDVQVTQVDVVIMDEQGAVYEQGAAVKAEGAWWTYMTTATANGGAQVFVTARDMPGNVAEYHWN